MRVKKKKEFPLWVVSFLYILEFPFELLLSYTYILTMAYYSDIDGTPFP